MLAIVYLVFIGLLAGVLQSRIRLLVPFDGLPRYLLSLGLTLFLVTWADFLVYVICGWGWAYFGVTWALVTVPTGWLVFKRGDAATRRARWAQFLQGLVTNWRRTVCLLLLSGLVLSRFYAGLDVLDGQLWVNFNFVDTAFHLSMSNAFVFSPRFPPMDLDMASYPLKYHFLADFFVAHLIKLDLLRLQAVWCMNLLSAMAMVGAVWAVFERWLKLSMRWVLLGGLIFLFLNTALLNLVHYWLLRPSYFNPAIPFEGLLWFPFFNFEAILTNLLEPQRGFLFTLPVVLLILDALYTEPAPDETVDPTGVVLRRGRGALMQAGILICLLPLAHIVAFAIMTFTAIPRMWVQRQWLLSKWRWWTPALVIGLLQLAYIFGYVPPPHGSYPTWFTFPLLPTEELPGAPRLVRRIVFWFMADGDFIAWSLFFAATAFFYRPLRLFLLRWRGYLITCTGFFLFINFFAFPFQWGDNNKYVLFLNLGLTLVIVQGAAQWIGRRGAWRSHLLWGFFFCLCVAPHAYEFYRDVFASPGGKILLFHGNGRAAAVWLRSNTQTTDVVLTAANTDSHFVTALSGRPTVAGIYGNTNVYQKYGTAEIVRRIYENGNLDLVRQLGARYVCISRVERRCFRISGRWKRLMALGEAVAFRAGEPDNPDSVYLFDVTQLPAQ